MEFTGKNLEALVYIGNTRLYQCAGKRTRDEKRKENDWKTKEMEIPDELATAYSIYKYQNSAMFADFTYLIHTLLVTR